METAQRRKKPVEWVLYSEKQTGKPYYFNVRTRECSWTEPANDGTNRIFSPDEYKGYRQERMKALEELRTEASSPSPTAPGDAIRSNEIPAASHVCAEHGPVVSDGPATTAPMAEKSAEQVPLGPDNDSQVEDANGAIVAEGAAASAGAAGEPDEAPKFERRGRAPSVNRRPRGLHNDKAALAVAQLASNAVGETSNVSTPVPEKSETPRTRRKSTLRVAMSLARFEEFVEKDTGKTYYVDRLTHRVVHDLSSIVESECSPHEKPTLQRSVTVANPSHYQERARMDREGSSLATPLEIADDAAEEMSAEQGVSFATEVDERDYSDDEDVTSPTTTAHRLLLTQIEDNPRKYSHRFSTPDGLPWKRASAAGLRVSLPDDAPTSGYSDADSDSDEDTSSLMDTIRSAPGSRRGSTFGGSSYVGSPLTPMDEPLLGAIDTLDISDGESKPDSYEFSNPIMASNKKKRETFTAWHKLLASPQGSAANLDLRGTFQANISPKDAANIAKSSASRSASRKLSRRRMPSHRNVSHALDLETSSARKRPISLAVGSQEPAMRAEPTKSLHHSHTIDSPLPRANSRASSTLESMRELHQYGKRFFDRYRKGLFRQKVKTSSMVAWRKDVMKTSLHKYHSTLYTREAVRMFEHIQVIMGDREPRVDAHEDVHRLTEELLQCGRKHVELRDELYCQLLKQTTMNPSYQSAMKGLVVLILCIKAFPPSIQFLPYLERWIICRMDEVRSQRILPRMPPNVACISDAMADMCTLLGFAVRRLRCYHESSVAEAHMPSLRQIRHAHLIFFRPVFCAKLPEIMRADRESLDRSDDGEISDYQGHVITSRGLRCPIVMEVLLRGILQYGGHRREGLFRVPGEMGAIHDLIAELARGNWHLVLSASAPRALQNPLVYADVLKLWLRELSEALIPSQQYRNAIAASGSVEETLQFVQSSVSEVHRIVISRLIGFLQFLSNNAEIVKVTKMHAENLAMIFGPSFFRNPVGDDDPVALMKAAPFEKRFVQHLIEHMEVDEVDRYSVEDAA